jgi:signal transduction histidine kinase
MASALQEAVTRRAGVINAILDQLPIGITVIDPSFRVTRFNQRAEEITGPLVRTPTPLHDWVVDLFHADGTPMSWDDRPSVRALLGETSRNVVFEIREPGRPAYLVSTSATPIRDDAGAVILAVSVFEDVTERRQREQADRDFVANAAHQIRTPIAAIASAFGALSAGAKNQPETRDRFLEHIEREVARMQQLAESLLALARAERGETPAVLSEIALRPLLQRVIDRSAPKDGVELELTCPEQLTAFTNEALMSEALANVVTNAMQHTAHGTVGLSGSQTADGARIDICDDGPGIPVLDRDRIFERFFRGARPAGNGVGLGLAIAAAATDAAGGVLELVESPAGACFRFSFEQVVLGA